MSQSTVVGFSGNITRPSKTFAFVDHIARDIAAATGLGAQSYDIEDLGPSLLQARRASDLDDPAPGVLGDHAMRLAIVQIAQQAERLAKVLLDLVVDVAESRVVHGKLGELPVARRRHDRPRGGRCGRIERLLAAPGEVALRGAGASDDRAHLCLDLVGGGARRRRRIGVRLREGRAESP